MIDPGRLGWQERKVWSRTFPGGFWFGAPHLEGPVFRLWSFAYICQFELGYVPAVVDEVLTADDYEAIGTYWSNVRAARERGE